MGSPPSLKKSHMLSQYYIWNLCWEEICHRGGRFAIWYYYSTLGKFCHGISSVGGGGVEGGGVAIWYYFPLGKFCYGISSGGRFAINYGIPSWGTFAI